MPNAEPGNAAPGSATAVFDSMDVQGLVQPSYMITCCDKSLFDSGRDSHEDVQGFCMKRFCGTIKAVYHDNFHALLSPLLCKCQV